MIRQFLIIFSFLPQIMFSQMRYSIVGTYQNKSAQGMAVWGDEAFLFNDGGHCRVLNLKNKNIEREFDLASSGKNMHVNAACFGREIVKGSKIPLLYISEYRSPSRCFVECISDTACCLIQTIQATNNGKTKFVQSWIVDREGGFLYAISRIPAHNKLKHSDIVNISKFQLPLLEKGKNIILTEDDCMDSFDVKFASGTQGGKIRGKYLFLATGLQESAKGRFNAERRLQVIDLEKRQLVRSIDLSYVTTNEPEDIDFYEGKCLLYSGQNGGIYEVDIK